MGRRLRTMILSVLVVVSLVLCIPIALNSGSDKKTENTASYSQLTIGSLQSLDSLNPYVGLADISYVFYGLVYDALMSVGNDLEVAPNLAYSWTPVPPSDPEMVGMPYGSIWQYNITQGAVWSDGEAFTADDVIYNIWLHAEVTHYDSMWAYQPYSYFMKQAWKVDDNTVRISFWNRETSEPMPASYAYLISIPMLPKHMLEVYPYSYIGMDWPGVFTESESPGMPIVCTGPFIGTPSLYSEWLAGDHITLVKNPTCHWGDDYGKSVKFDRLVIRFFQDSTAMVLALKNNEIDVASYPPTAYQSIKDDIEDGSLHNVSSFDGPKVNQYFTEIAFCMNEAGPNPSRLDPIIRHALHMATNKQYIVDNFYIGLGEVGTTLISPSNPNWHYEPTAEEKFRYNLTAAANLLESNGYIDVDDDGIRECTINSPAVQLGYVYEGKKLTYEMLVRKEYPEEKDTAQYLKGQWAQIGVNVQYLVVEELTLSGAAYSYAYDTLIWYWSSDIDPNYQLFALSTYAWNGWSDCKYGNPAYDYAYTCSVNTTDRMARKVFTDEAQRIFYNDSAYIITTYTHQTYVWRTDTFTGWGNWSADPGRSIDNCWTGNPLYFDLMPTGYNSPPTIDNLVVYPNPVMARADTYMSVVASDADGDAIGFEIYFGDGGSAIATGTNTTGPQYGNFVHVYRSPGSYDVTVVITDYNPGYGHTVTEVYHSRVLVGPRSWLNGYITPSELMMDVGESAIILATLEWNGDPLNGMDGMGYSWHVSPTDLGSFLYPNSHSPLFTAGPAHGSGQVYCNMTYYEVEYDVGADLTVNPQTLGSVIVTPSNTTMIVNTSSQFTATAWDTNGYEIQGAEFAWTVGGLSPGEYSLTPVTTGNSTVSFIGKVNGLAQLNATTTIDSTTKTGTSMVMLVSSFGDREVSYLWYDMFNVPFGDWWWKRWEIYHQELPLTNSYPYIFQYLESPSGNDYYYTNMRLNITGRNVTEVNMNSWPEFLPFLGYERGGNAQIDWDMQYLNKEELLERYGSGIANQYDGWIIDLNGTVVLDEQAAKAVLNVTDSGFDNFTAWWTANRLSVNQEYADWLVYEAEHRLDIENTYQSYYQLFVCYLDAVKVGGNIVVTCDILTWGMEALMMRWLREAFMPTEWWYEDMHFHASIGPGASSFDIDTGVDYAVFADQTILLTENGGTSGAPCWTWHGMLGDEVPSSIAHPRSEFDPYESLEYVVHRPGSDYYGNYIGYDYTPGCWNLSEGETLEFAWPGGDQQFKYHISPGAAVNYTSEMTVTYAEPMDTDFPGQVVVNDSAQTIQFVGPIDVWDWSRNQTEHWFLSDEWYRLGLLPYGQPLVEFSAKAPVQLFLDHFVIDIADSTPAGDFVTFDVTAIDQYGNVYVDYNGTVNFTSTDHLAILPANYTFTPSDMGPWSDAGTHTFLDGAVFGTIGPQLLNATDVSVTNPRSGSAIITVQPARTASYLLVDMYHLPAVGVPEDITVTVYDQYGDLFPNYTGTVRFGTNRTGKVTLPADYTFLLSDAGTHTITGGVDFKDTGWFSISATDTVVPSVTGSDSDIMVLPTPEVIDHFAVYGIQNMLQKQKSDVAVEAYQQYGMLFERYTGTIHFSTNDTEVVAAFPDDYTFIESDVGMKTFEDGVMFDVLEDKVLSVYVADILVTSAMGQQDNILIQYKPSSETFRMYDMFQQPWGEWWPWRYKGWTTDIILNNETGKYTMLCNPDQRGQQGIIYAPYRWNITGTNITSVSVDNPEFMPVLGTPNVTGAAASLEVYFEYLDSDWWYNYWAPYWKFPNAIFEDGMMSDGYLLGVVYDVVMNREAAESWMGMPQTANPNNWWIAHASDYIKAWSEWITYEGSVRLDIWNGYEWPYCDIGLKMHMYVLGNGDIRLEIGEISWGYEILMTRWLTETQLCNHEPYYEDATLSVTYYPQWIDFTFDAVCQYSLHAVKANESVMNEGAWAWEPLLIDYVDSSNGHPSTFDPWASETYQSWNAGDPQFGRQVGYDSGLQYFNLTSDQTFVIELPQGGNVLGYCAQTMPSNAILKIIRGTPSDYGHVYDRYPMGDGTNYNYEAYWPLMYNGTMSLGWYGNWTGAPDLDAMYDPVMKTITMVGPMSFDNTHHENGALYRGAPWIEFNVTMSAPDYTPPVAVASASPNPADPGTEVTLDGSLSSDNIGIVDYEWTFVHDGTPQELHGQVVQFVFLTSGTYTITLNCSDAAGNYDTTTIEIVINPLIPEFGYVPAVVIIMAALFVVVRRLRGRGR